MKPAIFSSREPENRVLLLVGDACREGLLTHVFADGVFVELDGRLEGESCFDEVPAQLGIRSPSGRMRLVLRGYASEVLSGDGHSWIVLKAGEGGKRRASGA